MLFHTAGLRQPYWKAGKAYSFAVPDRDICEILTGPWPHGMPMNVITTPLRKLSSWVRWWPRRTLTEPTDAMELARVMQTLNTWMARGERLHYLRWHIWEELEGARHSYLSSGNKWSQTIQEWHTWSGRTPSEMVSLSSVKLRYLQTPKYFPSMTFQRLERSKPLCYHEWVQNTIWYQQQCRCLVFRDTMTNRALTWQTRTKPSE